MDYCCICGREANQLKSFHCSIGDSVYHYCHRLAFIGKRVSDRYVAKLLAKPKCSCDTCFHNCTTWCDFQSHCKKNFMESDEETDKRLEEESRQK